MTGTNMQLIAKAIVRAAKKLPDRPLQISLVQLHEDFGSPSPVACGAYLAGEENMLPLGVALSQEGWQGPPPIYKDGHLFIQEWPSDICSLWDTVLVASGNYEASQQKATSAGQLLKHILTEFSEAANKAITGKA